uniref:Cathepsin L2 n=1 Tax=Sinohyriopsis schlegelii TaxID=2706150 RepID=T1UMG8_SINSH|nr:cathepsin L2 [Sinohyriopsis schlegelii]
MLRVFLLVGFLALGLSFNVELDDEWELYKTTYNKNYVQKEGLVRRFIWEDNLKRVQQHNLEADRGVHTYWLGMNEYADMTTEEFVSTMNGFKYDASKTNCGKFTFPSNLQLSDLPASIDWRTKGYVTPIKNQGQCGSCWAFSAVGSLEGQHFNKTKQLVSLSEQNLVDCSGKEGNMGCQGGLMDQAFKYIIVNKGIDTEASYPYKAQDQKCKFSQANVGATEVSCMDIRSGSEADLQKAVATVGPISVAIDASHNSFQLYKHGIYSDPQCDPQALDHGVLAVGYGTQDGKDYWLVKNSWGTSWGMQGYIMMARNKHNMCGIATKSSFPTV